MTKIALQAANGQYVCAEGGGGQKMVANRDAIGPWETFTLADLSNGKVALQASNGQYVCAEGGGGQLVVANRDARGPWEEFTLTDLGNDKVALQASNGQYVCAIGGGGQDLIANRDALGPWETFTKKSLEVITPSIASAHHWTFAEITDSVAIDSVSKAPAQLFNVKQSGQGRIGSAIALNGSDDSYVSLGRQIGQFGRSDFTVVFGVKIPAIAQKIELLGNRSTGDHGNFFSIRMAPGGQITAEVDEDSNGKNYIGLEGKEGRLDDGTWHHIAVVRQKNRLSLYVDGNLSKTGTANDVANIANGNEFRIGNPNPGISDGFSAPKAEFEDLRIYNRALSDIQISALVPPLKEGEIELKNKDGVCRIWNRDVADFGAIATNFQKLRLGSNTGVTLYKGTYFTDTFQEVVADLPDLSQTRLEAVPKSARIWSTVGKAFTGNWVIMAPNDQYLVLCPPLATSPEVSNLSLFDFHYNLERQWMQILPSLQLVGQQRILEIPTDAGLSQSLICQSEDSLYQFSLMNERRDRWLRFVPDCRFALRTLSGKYLRAEGGGGGAVVVDVTYPRLHEHFKLIQLGDNRVALQTLDKGLYVCAMDGGGGAVLANVSKLAGWETFILEKLEENRIALKTSAKGLYVCAENGGGGKLVADRSQRGSWETFELLNLGGFNWTANREERAIFTRAMKMAKDENQMGELLPGEAALYEHYGYWGKTLVLYNSCPDFRVLAGLNFNKTTSSIRLGPDTGATLYADINYSVTSTDRKNDIMDIVENVPKLGESQIGNDNLSSIKIWSNISPKQANVSFSISMSQDYRMKNEELEEFSSYRTILKFLPEVTEVEVWATDLTKFEIDETTYEVDEDRSVILSPNDMNRIMITSEAEGINTPGLKIRTNTMESHERVVIFPDREVHRQLANLKEGELWEAKDAQGNPLVDHSAYNPDQVASVQHTITKTMATVSYVAAGSEDNKYLVDREISADAIDKPWQLSFAKTAPVQEQGLSQSQFKQLADQASAPLAQGWRDGWRSFKDAVKKATSVVVGVIDKVVHVIVTTAEKVGAAIANAVQKVEDWIIDTAEKVGAFVEGVVEKIGVAAKKFVEFLRSIFDWGDILNTQRYLADAIDVGFDHAVELARDAKESVRKFMTGFKETVNDNLDEAIRKLRRDETELKKSEDTLPQESEWFLSKLLSNSKGSDNRAGSGIAAQTNQNSGAIEAFFSKMQSKFKKVSGTLTGSFEGVIETIIPLVKNPYRPQLALVVILETIQDIINDFLELLEELVLDFLDVIGLAINQFRNMIKAEINIPFISALFRRISGGQPLTMLNLSTLLAAIPATIISKLRFGRALEGTPRLAQGLFSDDLKGPVGVVTASCDLVNGIITGILDSIPELPDGVPPTPFQVKMETNSLILSCLSWVVSIPDSVDSEDETTAAKALYYTVWAYRSLLLGLDLFSVFVTKERFKRVEEWTSVINTVLYIIDLGLATAYLNVTSPEWEDWLTEYTALMPGFFSFLRWFNNPKLLLLLSAIDVASAGVVFGFEVASFHKEPQGATA